MSTTEEEQMRAKRAAWEKRWESYLERLPLFSAQLVAASDDNPVVRAVVDLHRLKEAPVEPQCTECLLYEDDHQSWPCDTISVVAEALNMEVPTP